MRNSEEKKQLLQSHMIT